MDSLSVSVAITGLLGSAETVRRKVNISSERYTDAASLAKAVLLEVSTIEAALQRFQGVLQDGRASLVRENVLVDQLSTLLTGCGKQFSDLESLFNGLSTNAMIGPTAIDESTWGRFDRHIRATVKRIQPYRASMLLMLCALESHPQEEQGDPIGRVQNDLGELQDRTLSTDGDLATRIGKFEVRSGSCIAPTPPFFLERHLSDPGEVTAANGAASPISPTGGLHSTDEKRRPAWMASWRSRTHRSDELMQRSSRPKSATTSSSITSGSTVSTISTSSRSSLAAASNPAVYKLPITPEDVSDGHHSTGITEDPAISSLAGETGDGAANSSSLHRKLLPNLIRPGAEQHASAVHAEPLRGANQVSVPTAEIEMSARKYQGYWRPSFAVDVPAVAAMCGTLLVATGAPTGPSTRLIENAETAARVADLCDTLIHAPSPAKLIKTFQTHRLETMLFALKASISSSQVPVVPAVPAKIAFAIYHRIAEAKSDPKKTPKVWPHVAKALKKIPQQTIVPLMFLVAIGRKLRSRGLMVGNRSAAAYLMEFLWPQMGSRSLFALDTEAGDAVTKLLLDNYDDIPDELPVMLQTVNYRFESGSKCNLLALLTTKKAPS